MRIRSVTCAKNNDEPCDVTRKPNSRALCGLQQCPSSRGVLRPPKGMISHGKKLPTSEQDRLKPTTPNPRMLTVPMVPETVSTSSLALSSPSPTTASEGDRGGKWWQDSSTQTELDYHDVISSGSTSQPTLTSWSLSIQPNEENVSKSAPGPTSEGNLLATTMSGSDLSSSSNPVTWHLTPFYTLTKEPEMELHSGSGEDSEQPENKNENSSIIWTKTRGHENDASVERSTEMPLGPLPTPYLWGVSLRSPFSTVAEGLLPTQRPTTLKNGTPRAEGMVTEKPANTPLPLGGDHQSAPSEKLINHNLPELSSNMNLTLTSRPVLTEEDATSLIAEGFLLNASHYKQLSTGHSTARWIVGNWSEVGVPCLTPCLFLYGR